MKKIKFISILLASLVFMNIVLIACKKDNTPPVINPPDNNQTINDTEHVLYDNGQTDYRIIIPAEYTASEQFAAQELANIFYLASKTTPEIISENDNDIKTNLISIGDTQIMTDAEVVATYEEFGRDGYRIKTVGTNVVLAAAGEVGKIYSVYEFARVNLGYTYYAADEIAVTKNSKVMLKDFDLTDTPSFIGRDVYSYDTRTNADHSIRLRTNGIYPPWQSKHGEGTHWSTLNDQSFVTQILRYEEYVDEHSDWYYLEPNNNSGKSLYAQIDFWKGYYDDQGSDSMFWTFVNNLINDYIIPETKKSFFMLGITDNTFFGTGLKPPVAISDDASQQEKDEYASKLAKYNQDIASYNEDLDKYHKSGMAMRFINKVADEVEKWRKENAPEREINLVTFAYAALFEAPTKVVDGQHIPLDDSVIARDNVIVRYAPISAYYMYDLLNEEYNAESKESILGWSAVASKLAVWDYRVDYWSYGVPFPQWQSAYANLKIYYDYGFIDVYNQGCTPNSGTPFVTLDNYVRSRLLWDIELDYNELTDDFINHYYKEAAPYIDEYRTLLMIHFENHIKSLNYAGHSHYGLMVANFWPETIINSIENIFLEAYKEITPIADTDPELYQKIKTRLDTESIFYRLAQLELYRANYNPSERLIKINALEEIAKKAGFIVTSVGNIELATYINNWRSEIN